MAKKRFGISASTNQALSQTMQMAKAQDSNFVSTDILINRIHIDPENPRKHKIAITDLEAGPAAGDADYKVKQEEYQGLCELSESIAKEGLLHPIIVFKHGDDYRLVAGERRFLASIIAKKTLIEARVFKTKPEELELRIIQWIENESRKDLSLQEKLFNIASIVEAFTQNAAEKMTALKLSKLLSTSRPSAQLYMAILSNKILMSLIGEGRVTTLRSAQKLSGYSVKADLLKALEMLLAGKNMPVKNNKKLIAKGKSKAVGRRRQKIALGTTAQPIVAETIVQNILAVDQFKKYAVNFKEVDWACLDTSTKAFQRFIKLLEKELEVTV